MFTALSAFTTLTLSVLAAAKPIGNGYWPASPSCETSLAVGGVPTGLPGSATTVAGDIPTVTVTVYASGTTNIPTSLPGSITHVGSTIAGGIPSTIPGGLNPGGSGTGSGYPPSHTSLPVGGDPGAGTGTGTGTGSSYYPSTTSLSGGGDPGNGSAGQCNTGPIQCCNSVQSASSNAASTLLGLLGIVVQDLNVLVGLDCNPIGVIGIGGNSCTAQPVCCENNNFNGIVSLGCTPVNLNL
ncbi:hypothetical protein VKT23_009288 [Stygiomarasmius scandens]|uniref:Hydrophobin n=1 Tax=Marasmiellus scandens TaxID=2682957 RepID=A0ABR1JFL5_9AGAR